MFDDQDRLDRERSWIGCIIAVVFGGGIMTLLACGGLVVLLAMESGESSPQEARDWFKIVVHADPSLFTDIQHYTDQGIDFSHHFRFGFSDLDDLQPIIKYNGLTTAPNSDAMHMEHLPNWYDPFSVPVGSLRFGCGGSEPMLLIVDPDAKIAYFEMVHI